jgi:F-type H+-transporting ATPase subunit epsilon
MAEGITLEIVTPERLVFAEQVDEVVLPSLLGYMGVRRGHAPLLAQLDVGELSFLSGGTKKLFAVAGGFAEVLRDSVEILAHTCEPAEEIDATRAEQARERARTRLQTHASDLDFARAEVALKKAISRLEVHTHLKG